MPVAAMPTEMGWGTLSCGVGDDAGEDQRDGDVEHRADGERAEDADGQIALRVARLLGGGGDGVEADVGEEDHGRALQDAGAAEAAEDALVRGDEGRPVLGLHVGGGGGDEGQHHRDLDEDDDGVEAGRLLDADDQDDGHAPARRGPRAG